jgi:hypothetical protein
VSYGPASAYLTHFGRVAVTADLVARLRESIDALAATAQAAAGLRESRLAHLKAAVGEQLVAEARSHGVTLEEARMRELLAVDIELNAQGLEVWLVRQEKRRAE